MNPQVETMNTFTIQIVKQRRFLKLIINQETEFALLEIDIFNQNREAQVRNNNLFIMNRGKIYKNSF